MVQASCLLVIRRLEACTTRPPSALLELRSNLVAAAGALAGAAKQFDEADDKLVALERVRELMTAGVKLTKVNPKDLGLARIDEPSVQAALKTVAVTRDGARRRLDHALAGGMERLSLALSLEKVAVPATAAQPAPVAEDSYDIVEAPKVGSDDLLLDALRVLRESAADVEALRRHFILLGTVLSQVQPGQNPQSLIDTVLWHSRKCSDLLRSIHAVLLPAKYPYSHAEKQVSVAQYMTSSLPPGDEVVAVHNAADSATDAVYSLYVRLLSDLAARAEKVEEQLGLPRLPDPPEDKVEEDGK